jgi:hypothetical protein
VKARRPTTPARHKLELRKERVRDLAREALASAAGALPRPDIPTGNARCDPTTSH